MFTLPIMSCFCWLWKVCVLWYINFAPDTSQHARGPWWNLSIQSGIYYGTLLNLVLVEVWLFEWLFSNYGWITIVERDWYCILKGIYPNLGWTKEIECVMLPSNMKNIFIPFKVFYITFLIIFEISFIYIPNCIYF